MGKIKDLTNQKFGELTVLEITPERKNRQVVWKCQCSCGNITYVVGQALRNGHTQTCGCSWKKDKAKDLTGQTFGKLLVLKRNQEKINNSRAAFWDCQCECGNLRTVSGSDLRTNKVVECHNCACKNRKPRDPKSYIGPIKNKVGERFGKLVVQEDTGKRKNGKVVWKCQCDCGNVCEVDSNSLITGNTHSCGCLAKKSYGEFEVEKLLKEGKINFIKQAILPNVSDKIALRYDFAILNANNEIERLIEFDGEQHYIPIDFFGGEEAFQKQKYRDTLKNEGALKLQIPLVRIPYTKLKTLTLENLLGDEFLVKF